MRILNSILILVGLCLVSAYSHNIANSPTVHFYFTPRNVNYGWADRGVFKFSLNEESLKVPFDKRSFTTSVKVDSVYELFYYKELGETKLLRQIELSHKVKSNKQFLFPRILIIIDDSFKKDSLLIDKNYNVSYNKKEYQLNNDLKEVLLDLMPAEFRDNWIYNKPSR